MNNFNVKNRHKIIEFEKGRLEQALTFATFSLQKGKSGMFRKIRQTVLPNCCDMNWLNPILSNFPSFGVNFIIKKIYD